MKRQIDFTENSRNYKNKKKQNLLIISCSIIVFKQDENNEYHLDRYNLIQLQSFHVIPLFKMHIELL